MIGSDPDKFELYGSADEKYYVKGGTQQLTNKLHELLNMSDMCTIHLNEPITKISKINDKYALNSLYEFSHIVMTIPFQMYDLIDYSKAEFSPMKQHIIKNYKLGSNTKINIQYNGSLDFNGVSFVSTLFSTENQLISQSLDCESTEKMNQCQNTWNGTIDNYNHDSTVLVNYTGGEYATTISNEFITKNSNKLVKPLDDLDVLFANASTSDNIKPEILNVVGINWSLYPWTKGAYSVYKVGQYSGGLFSFAGLEGQTEYRCYFAGKATDLKSQGYMNAAVSSANRVIKDILISI